MTGKKDRECDRAESITEQSGDEFKSRESNWGGTWSILRLPMEQRSLIY